MELEDLCTAVLGMQPPSSVTAPDGIDREALLRLTSLTARESEVLTHAIFGMKVREIANELSITPHTVQTHKRRIFAKLGVQSQAQAITLATRAGLVPLNRGSGR
jgi:DNA-binding CsgD family transcriptional regulator